MKKSYVFVLGLSFLAISCIEKPDAIPTELSETETSLNFPADFDFGTSQTVALAITDQENADQVRFVVSYEFEGQTHKVLSTGRAVLEDNPTITLPTAVTSLTVEKQTAQGVATKTVKVIGNQVRADFQYQNEGLVNNGSNSCIDHLYAVNSNRGFYQIDLSNDQYAPTTLPDLEGGGSIANALDQENGLVYYNVNRTLYQYDVYTGEFSIKHTSNPFDGNYPRLTYKDGYFWMSNNTKLFKVNAATNEVVSEYTVTGFVNNSGGGDLAFDSQGDLYLACFSGLYKFVSFGEGTATITRISAENFPFQLTSMAIDRQDRIYVGTNDSNSNLIQISKEDGSYQIVRTYDFKINDLTAWRCDEADLEQIDTDNDGIIDELDDYPNDPGAAYDIFTPSEIGMGTLAFEDLWPVKGDYDFNDLVLGYRFVNVLNADNLAVRMEIELTIRAVGASQHNGFGIQLPVDESVISQVSGSEIFGNQVTLNTKGLESGQSSPTVIVFNDSFDHMRASSGNFINTVVGESAVPEKSFKIIIEFTNPIDPTPLNNPPFNPFIFSSLERGKEVHLAGNAPTDLADTAFFGTADDDTQPDLDRYYQSADNTPWAIHVIHRFRYPKEKSRIDEAYNYFKPWGQSRGTVYKDWYGDNNGYRNLSRIYDNQ